VLDRVGLTALVKRHQPQRIFEIGTFLSVTATTMAANAPSGSVLYTLDLRPI
jgi:predicted O-methyltransferase YrrM